ncbi:MAG TPA: M12 family metallopeptidase [Asticcacaulis sp.]|nr:M12 family metallopeptidase [Asticcacaulis sp.]
MAKAAVAGLVLAVFCATGPVNAAAVMSGTQPWPGGVVYYRIDDLLLKRAVAKAKDCTGWRTWSAAAQAAKACQAMDAWQTAAGVRFVAQDRLDAVTIVDSRATTAGTLGHLPVGNRITLERGATYGSILHEFGHVLGLMHEHQRPDRDSYLRLEPFLQNYVDHCGLSLSAVCNDVRLAFPKVSVQMSTPYDPCSLMHYLSNQTPRHREDPRWRRIFTLTQDGQAALDACIPQFAKLPPRCRKVGQKCAISEQDAALVRRFNGVKS